MLKIKQKIPAFTILEITLSMVIIGVLITLIYNVINFFAFQSNKDMKHSLVINNWVLFRQGFYEDIYLAEQLKVTENTIYLLRSSDTIVYSIEDGQLSKKRNRGIVNLGYQNVTLECNKSSTDKFDNCKLTVPILEEPMQLNFSTFQDRSSRVNEWHKNQFNYE